MVQGDSDERNYLQGVDEVQLNQTASEGPSLPPIMETRVPTMSEETKVLCYFKINISIVFYSCDVPLAYISL